MKKIDYYAVHNPWRMPKWLGATLGGIFGVIVIGSMITIVQLTKSPTPPPAPVVALAAAPIAQAPTAAPVAPAAAVKASAPVASADEVAPVGKRHSSRHHHASASHGKRGRLLASAKHSSSGSSLGAAQRQTILAKHDSKDKRHDKDALDKLLGL